MARVLKAGEGTRLDLPGRAATEIAGAGAGTASTTVRIVEIAPGPSSRGPHVHDGFEEVIHVLEGHGRFRADSGATEIGPGDTVIVPPGERHATENTGEGTLRLVCAFPVADIRPGTREFASWDDA